MPEEAGLVNTYQVQCDAVAGAASGLNVVCQAEFAGTVTGCRYVAVSAITGANTNTRKHDLVNAGQAGAGTTVIATKQYNSGVNAAALDETVITLSSTAADLVVAAGDTIVLKSTLVGTGIADPGGTIFVDITRSA
jgi:hypothetical protein